MRVRLKSPYGGLFSTQTTRLYCKVQSSYLDLNNIVKAKVYPNADKNKSEILEDNKRKPVFTYELIQLMVKFISVQL